MIYFSSDLHLNHNKDFIYAARGFQNVDEMNTAIIKNFNKVISYDDDLYLLGDTFLGELEAGIKLFNQLPGKIHLLWGNHDTNNRIAALSQCHNVVEVIGYAGMLKYKKFNFYLSHYPTITTNFDDYQKPLYRRTLNISGHTHSFEEFSPEGCYNVALEAHNCSPVSIDEIIQKFLDKIN